MSGGNVLQEFERVIGDHVPPEAENITEKEVCLRVPTRYRIRVRGSDMQFEAVARFTGFDVPTEDAPEVLILEFTSEHSFDTDQDNG